MSVQGMRFGTDAGGEFGDMGDKYMDAPAMGDGKFGTGNGDSKGWNPISALLDAVGIHIGGKGLPAPKAPESKDSAPAKPTEESQMPASSAAVPSIAVPTVSQSTGGSLGAGKYPTMFSSLKDMGLTLE